MAKLTYNDEMHKEMCIYFKQTIYKNYREFYGRKEGHYQFQMWSAVTCLNLLEVGAKRSVELNDEPLIEQEEG